MIIGIGTDLTETERIRKAMLRPSFGLRVFTEDERKLFAIRPQSAAGNFAAKEAVVKALGCGFAGISPAEVEILRNKEGKPYVVLHGGAKEKAEKAGVSAIHVSISDIADYAQAYAVCEGEEGTPRKRNEKEDGAEGIAGRHDDAFFGGIPKKTDLIWPTLAKEAAIIPVLTGTERKQADRTAMNDYGIPSPELMERAAKAVADRVLALTGAKDKIVVLCGNGNNGGDGLAVARICKLAGRNVTVVEPEFMNRTKATPEFRLQEERARLVGVAFGGAQATSEADFLVDALFGVGLSRDLDGECKKLVEKINESKCTVLAIDIPSGISADNGAVCGTAIAADETVTFDSAMPGHLCYPGKKYTGKLTVANGIFPKEAVEAYASGYCLQKPFLTERPEQSNKGTFGKVLIIGGSRNMAGAGLFSALAAYRSGAGLVRIFTAECNRVICQERLPEAMLTTYREESDETELAALLEDSVNWADTVVIGPGIGQTKQTIFLTKHLQKILSERGEAAKTCIWDADALNLLALQMTNCGRTSPKERCNFLKYEMPVHSVFTPHPGELGRLLNLPVGELTADPVKTAEHFLDAKQRSFVLKDAVTIVVEQGKMYYNTSGNSGMATGGSGDVLTGILAAMSATKTEKNAAVSRIAAGVMLHGTAGDLAAKKYGKMAMMATDLCNAIGEAAEELQWNLL